MKRLNVAMLVLLAGCVDRQQVLFAPDAGAPFVPAIDLGVGYQHACAILDGGTLWCWGANQSGELGVASVGDVPAPKRVGSTQGWQNVQAGVESTCALNEKGEVWCWGGNHGGEVGSGDFALQPSPRQVALQAPARRLSVGDHTCVVLSDQSLWCWGTNQEGQLGLNDSFVGPTNRPSPQQVVAGSQWLEISATEGHTCGIQVDGSLWCWGRNTSAQLGLGVGADPQLRKPMQVGSRRDWQSVSTHQEGTCAIARDATLWCWGASAEAVLGVRVDLSPTQVGTGIEWASVDADTFFTCALTPGADAWCWGRNYEAQLASGDVLDDYVPKRREGGVVQLGDGRFSRCIRDQEGAIRCSGQNSRGQVGVGDFSPRLTLTLVSFE